MKKERFVDWWKQDKRYMTLLKAVLMALLPLLCCLVRTAAEGRSIGQVYLPSSEWNDELFYFKQVEGIVNYGFPRGYFGFNESHALQLSFAAWSPVLDPVGTAVRLESAVSGDLQYRAADDHHVRICLAGEAHLETAGDPDGIVQPVFPVCQIYAVRYAGGHLLWHADPVLRTGFFLSE